ncbi:MAG: N-acetyl-gamma-glutamyl-phosphate reductase [Opitutaceae bacterium]|nr:N-acetyl-gamma-glutamyl-phosphate reductase [Opitutaceae bacterium]|tara:strand:+ start:1630 stop:2655 length:1026 start_codon:yes stop_codon:yes gene_type:complete
MNVGIVGASGYSGEVLLSILLDHPKVSLTKVTSRKLAGQPVKTVFPALKNRANDLSFSASDPEELANDTELELVFLALPHGLGSEYAVPLCEAGKKVIDLSADFRMKSPDIYEEYYGQPHPHPDWLSKSSYIIPEIMEDDWQSKQLIAAPGCYPTSILIPLIPLIKNSVIKTENIVINSISGISGAGRKLAGDYLYCERNESVRAYGLGKHRHLSEIEEQLSLVAGRNITVQFTPHLAPMNRGIATTMVIGNSGEFLEEVYKTWEASYRDAPFVGILESDKTPDTKWVTHSNRIDIAATGDPRTGNLLITSAEDNLMKGASGQAVQIMNLWYGFNETAGLI